MAIFLVETPHMTEFDTKQTTQIVCNRRTPSHLPLHTLPSPTATPSLAHLTPVHLATFPRPPFHLPSPIEESTVHGARQAHGTAWHGTELHGTTTPWAATLMSKVYSRQEVVGAVARDRTGCQMEAGHQPQQQNIKRSWERSRPGSSVRRLTHWARWVRARVVRARACV